MGTAATTLETDPGSAALTEPGADGRALEPGWIGAGMPGLVRPGAWLARGRRLRR